MATINLYDIVFPELPLVTEAEFWENTSMGEVVEPLSKPCHDCAVTTGFYLEYAVMLEKQPVEIQNKVLDTWFCHNACNRGCAGIRDYIKNKLCK